MPELEAAGYNWLRARVYEQWRYIGVFDVDGNLLAMIDTQTDPRVARTINDATMEVEIEVRLRGDDPEFVDNLPVRIASTKLFPAPDAEYRSRVTYSPRALASATDGEILVHRVHVPVAMLTGVL